MSLGMNGFEKCIMCKPCCTKYPKIKNGRLIDFAALEEYGCEICEGDTNPADFGYGTREQIEEANYIYNHNESFYR
jgi:hypothetical protein